MKQAFDALEFIIYFLFFIFVISLPPLNKNPRSALKIHG